MRGHIAAVSFAGHRRRPDQCVLSVEDIRSSYIVDLGKLAGIVWCRVVSRHSDQRAIALLLNYSRNKVEQRTWIYGSYSIVALAVVTHTKNAYAIYTTAGNL